MRWNWPPMACASVLIAIVLASPGTPSTSRWPRASSATSIRSSSPSWPTIVFLTWYRVGSSGSARGRRRLGVLFHGLACPDATAAARRPRRPAVAIGTAKPIPTKKFCRAGLASAVTMPTTCPARLSSGPPLLPGLTAASNWMSPVRVGPRSVADRCGRWPTPRRRSGCAAGRAGCRRRTRRRRPAAGRPAPRARRPPGSRSTASTAMSLLRLGGRAPARAGVVPSANSTWIWAAPSTTCRAVSTAPPALTTTPLPRPVVGAARPGPLDAAWSR